MTAAKLTKSPSGVGDTSGRPGLPDPQAGPFGGPQPLTLVRMDFWSVLAPWPSLLQPRVHGQLGVVLAAQSIPPAPEKVSPAPERVRSCREVCCPPDIEGQVAAPEGQTDSARSQAGGCGEPGGQPQHAVDCGRIGNKRG